MYKVAVRSNTNAAPTLEEIEVTMRNTLDCVVSARTLAGDKAEAMARRAAWMLADAGLMLRQAMEADGMDEGVGLDELTGRGAVLPVDRRPDFGYRRGMSEYQAIMLNGLGEGVTDFFPTITAARTWAEQNGDKGDRCEIRNRWNEVVAVHATDWRGWFKASVRQKGSVAR